MTLSCEKLLYICGIVGMCVGNLIEPCIGYRPEGTVCIIHFLQMKLAALRNEVETFAVKFRLPGQQVGFLNQSLF